MANNGGNRGNRGSNFQNKTAPAATSETPENPTEGGGIPIPPKKPEDGTDGDTVTLASTPPAPPADEAVDATIEAIEPEAPVVETEEHVHVVQLRSMLNEFKQLTLAGRDKPESYAGAARVGSAITQFVMRFPSTPVLDELYAFFDKNEDGAADGENLLKGATTVSMIEQRQMGFLFTLFRDLADKKFVRISNAEVIKVLKRQDIAAYYHRRVAGFKQAAGL